VTAALGEAWHAIQALQPNVPDDVTRCVRF